MIRLGLVQYLNALPFHISLNVNNLQITYGHPTELNAALATHRLDAALTSAVERSSYKQLPLGICCSGPVLSVSLFLNRPLVDGIRIALTSKSATSVALLKVLCHHFWRVTPLFVREEEPHEGKLLIGDEALRHKGFHIDLGEAWWRETHLPFVFALLLSHEDIETTPLQTALESSLNWSASHFPHLIEEALKRSSLPKPLLEQYYRSLHYRLAEKEWEGLQLFSTLYRSLDVQLHPA